MRGGGFESLIWQWCGGDQSDNGGGGPIVFG